MLFLENLLVVGQPLLDLGYAQGFESCPALPDLVVLDQACQRSHLQRLLDQAVEIFAGQCNSSLGLFDIANSGLENIELIGSRFAVGLGLGSL